jgi:hypothetical protein
VQDGRLPQNFIQQCFDGNIKTFQTTFSLTAEDAFIAALQFYGNNLKDTIEAGYRDTVINFLSIQGIDTIAALTKKTYGEVLAACGYKQNLEGLEKYIKDFSKNDWVQFCKDVNERPYIRLFNECDLSGRDLLQLTDTALTQATNASDIATIMKAFWGEDEGLKLYLEMADLQHAGGLGILAGKTSIDPTPTPQALAEALFGKDVEKAVQTTKEIFKLNLKKRDDFTLLFTIAEEKMPALLQAIDTPLENFLADTPLDTLIAWKIYTPDIDGFQTFVAHFYSDFYALNNPALAEQPFNISESDITQTLNKRKEEIQAALDEAATKNPLYTGAVTTLNNIAAMAGYSGELAPFTLHGTADGKAYAAFTLTYNMIDGTPTDSQTESQKLLWKLHNGINQRFSPQATESFIDEKNPESQVTLNEITERFGYEYMY